MFVTFRSSLQADAVSKCAAQELHEFHELVAKGTRCPLYALMKEWIVQSYGGAMEQDAGDGKPRAGKRQGPAKLTMLLMMPLLAGPTSATCLKTGR